MHVVCTYTGYILSFYPRERGGEGGGGEMGVAMTEVSHNVTVPLRGVSHNVIIFTLYYHTIIICFGELIMT